MKILHVVHAYPPSIGGSQWLVKNLSERLVADYGDTVTVFTTVADQVDYLARGRGRPLAAGTVVEHGVTVRRFPVVTQGSWLREALAAVAYRLRLPGNDWACTLHNGPVIPNMPRAIAHSGVDIIFATAFPLLHMYYALWGARRAGIPVVLLGALHLADTWNYDRPNIYHAIRRADAYIAHSTAERDVVMAHGLSADKVHVIGGGVDAAALAATDGAVVRRENGWGTAPIVLLLGKQVQRKRYDLLIGAMRQLWAEYPMARLVLAGGSTPYSAEIRRQIGELPPSQQAQITLRTDVGEAEKAGLLAACDLLVLPSSEDSFGLVLAEAWACGKPVIAARTPVMASLVEDGVDGMLFTPGDGDDLGRVVCTLLADHGTRQRLGRAGQRKVTEKFTWDAVTAQVRAVYESCLGKRQEKAAR